MSSAIHTSREVSTLVRGWLQSSTSGSDPSSPAVQSVSLPSNPPPLAINRPDRLGLGAEKEFGVAKKKKDEHSKLLKKIRKQIINKKLMNSIDNDKSVTVNESLNNQNQNESEDETSCSKITIVSSTKTRKHKLKSLKKQKLETKRRIRKKKRKSNI